MKSDQVKAALMIAAAGGALYLGWRAMRAGSDVVGSISDAIGGAVDTVLALPGQALDAVQKGVGVIGVNYAVDVSPSDGLTDAERARGKAYLDGQAWAQGGNGTLWDWMASGFGKVGVNYAAQPTAWYMSDEAANAARRDFASTDPRRVDL